jgi:hypothetical protein
MFVKAKVAHTQPGSHAYREEGEQFEHDGKPYKHVEVLKQPKASTDNEPEDERPNLTKK